MKRGLAAADEGSGATKAWRLSPLLSSAVVCRRTGGSSSQASAHTVIAGRPLFADVA